MKVGWKAMDSRGSTLYPFENKADKNVKPVGKGQMSDDSILREKARNLILAGILPDRPPDHMWGGAGASAQCIVCSARVKREEVRLEIEYTLDDGAGTGNYHVHVRCYSALESERHKLQLARSAPHTPGETASGAPESMVDGRKKGA